MTELMTADELSLFDLATLKDWRDTVLSSAIADLEAVAMAEADDVVRQALEAAGIDFAVYMAAKTPAQKTSKLAGTTKPIKYRNPQDHSETWAGIGYVPKWLRDKINVPKETTHTMFLNDATLMTKLKPYVVATVEQAQTEAPETEQTPARVQPKPPQTQAEMRAAAQAKMRNKAA